MIRFFYNLLLWLLLPVIALYHAYRSVSRGRRMAFAERFGFIPASDLDRVRGAEVLLVHAVSVGETIAVLPLLKALKARYPGKRVVLSNGTETGRSVALKSGVPDLCIYFPFDYPFAVATMLERLKPRLVVIMETEIWPNFNHHAARLGIPVVLANGRISDRSFGRYQRLSWFFAPVLRTFSALCMQTAQDASRIIAIGAPAGKVSVAGNLKYEIPLREISAAQSAALKAEYRVPPEAFVFTGASTHPGEEELVLDAYQALLAAGGDNFLVLVPRHPERAASVAELIRKRGLSFRLRSSLVTGVPAARPGEILLLDTVGELMKIFSLSDLVFMGGSLVPTGGHNPLEPASCGVPVLFGPHMENFREIAAGFLSYGAALKVADGNALSEQVVTLARDAELRQTIGGQGLKILQDNSGATDRHLAAVDRCLNERTASEAAQGRTRG
ncbi:3-deoxy-D-manno-octulosonic acid transferase [Geomonas sp. Red32]|uniref:3-deoxy-D-manno-octulosonic acid transferase n=1 Tax=Geomonas sp. Red32 TaxID=2912856 RepID=UPI00202CE12E|nr:3-deoxy-D-manno-octulosonic acid transferase [Geomonas sp. Red32]MCM0082811.1 3-deoxy-D-manno-octulosonic acid transferase [Geomonas sp. Red32]